MYKRQEQIDKGEPLLGVETGDVVVQEHSWEGVEKIAEDELLLGEGIVLVEGIDLFGGIVLVEGIDDEQLQERVDQIRER